jgi:segregation and condensation protein A
MAQTFAVGEFEGPLALLLDLVQKGKLEVSRVSVGQITSEYLARVREIKAVTAEELSEFLQLGARLLYIKSLALLPPENPDEQVRELEQLSHELDEYRRFQQAAAQLAERAARPTWPRPAAPRLPSHELPLPELSLAQLAEAFTRALKLAPVEPPPRLIAPHLSLETVAARLRKRLPEGFELGQIIDNCRDRLEIVVTFLALLDLIREGVAQVTQAGQFDPIRVEAARA